MRVYSYHFVPNLSSVAVMAQNKSTSANQEERKSAEQLGEASYNVSAAGIVLGVVITIIVIIVRSTWQQPENIDLVQLSVDSR